MDELEIDVRFEGEPEAPLMDEGGRPMLTYTRHPEHGYGWVLWYLSDPHSDTAGVEQQFIPGELTDVDTAVECARLWLVMMYGLNGYCPSGPGTRWHS